MVLKRQEEFREVDFDLIGTEAHNFVCSLVNDHPELAIIVLAPNIGYSYGVLFVEC